MRIYIFPFDRVDKDTQIIIWGLGIIGKEYINEILAINYCNVKYIIDSYSNREEYKGISVYNPGEVEIDKSCTYIISIFDLREAENIKKQLLQNGVPKIHIIHSCNKCNLEECAKDIIRIYNPWNEGIDFVQQSVMDNGFYFAGIPFFVKNKNRIGEYIQIKNKFCETNHIVNSLDQTRVFFLWQNIENVLDNVEGDVAEVGVYQGATAVILEKYCIKYGRKLFLFDTFEGFVSKDTIGIDSEKKQEDFKDTSLEFVRKRLEYEENIHIKKGCFPDTIDDETRKTSYAFVHIDCDLYRPIIESLKFFWPRLKEGGMVVVHDYSSGFWKGASKAVDEFCEDNKISKILIPDWSGTVVFVKNNSK